MTPSLMSWFEEMFRYAGESRGALKVTEGLLDANGPFGSGRFFEDRRAVRFLLALADAAPKAALRYVQRNIGTLDTKRLLEFEEGRREVVWALERIAVWRELFFGAADLLLQLAEAENESFANNATGVFASLFSPGEGPLAPTEASPEERFPLLAGALRSASPGRRRVALRACDQALETQSLIRFVGVEYQGLRVPPRLWTRRDLEEVLDAYRRVWNLVVEAIEVLEGGERQEAVEVLLKHAGGLALSAALSEMVVASLEVLVARSYASRRSIIDTVEGTLHYSGKRLPPESRDRLESLRRQLVESTVHARLERYVAMDVIHDAFDEQGNPVDKVGAQIESLATELLHESALLNAEVPWLATVTGSNAHRFGRALSAQDQDSSVLDALLGAQREAPKGTGAFLLGGYLSALFQRDLPTWERVLDNMSADEKLRDNVPEVTWRSGMTERAAVRILRLVESNAVPREALRMFAYGGVIRTVPENVLGLWVERLLKAPTRASVSSALSLLFFYYNMPPSRGVPPRALTARVLTAGPFFEGPSERTALNEEYEWSELAKRLVDLYPEEGGAIARMLVQNFGAEGTVAARFVSAAHEVLAKIAGAAPEATWTQIADVLGPPISGRAFRLGRWLRNGGLALMRFEDVLAWVDEDVERRAWYLVTCITEYDSTMLHHAACSKTALSFSADKSATSSRLGYGRAEAGPLMLDVLG
jgi:hypothetical protein